MEKGNKGVKSPLNDELAYEQAVKSDAAFRIDSAIVEKKFALEYMRLQLEELPVPRRTRIGRRTRGKR